MNIDHTIIADDLRFPEGPVWMKDGGIILVEIAAGRISRIAPDGTRTTVAEPGGGPNGLAIGPDGALYCCNNGGFQYDDMDGLLIPGMLAEDYSGGRIERIDLETGAVTTLYDNWNGQSLSGPNDIVFDYSGGGFWFTDLGKVRGTAHDHGGLYWARADGSEIKQCAHGPNMNGVGLSPDGRTVYTALTNERLLLSFNITGPGEVEPSPVPAFPGNVLHSFPGRTLLDSLAVDAAGNICVATLLEAPGIASIHPETGEREQFDFPDLLTTNICFGGPDMQDAWITLSTTGKLAKCRWPGPGLKLAYYR
ncbi:SMP-30/gluconolactonase/LRE family protein [Pacificimonas sp. WHA3]|uniref:SMP-30/gluconolactonase/LRE family protein n=1 Tax=Pacificimonas pallii TaxID=2827236 RepID=A0ABS6SIF4_9SPHN|nr:SMP-30/gluconolactonase/LRE family protein [Pacificimonas pallii]MBV7257838.1 SMP-30/gluconolactonase/LRE family protein [Pacificimonas pallii]